MEHETQLSGRGTKNANLPVRTDEMPVPIP